MGLEDKKRLTLNAINKEIRALGYKKVELVRGYGYYYWSGGVAGKFFESGVYGSPYLNSLTLRQWVNDFKHKVAKAKAEGRL